MPVALEWLATRSDGPAILAGRQARLPLEKAREVALVGKAGAPGKNGQGLF
jgi:hypothetical protein